MFSPAGAERICKNMLYSIVGIDYHKNRAVSTKSFESTSLSAACKKRQGKLWQKKRGSDDAIPLDMLQFFEGVATTGWGTYTIGSSASLRWVGKDRQLPRPSAHPSATEQELAALPAAPFPHQPEPRCNTLDFAGKVVYQRALRLFGNSATKKGKTDFSALPFFRPA